MLYGDKVCVLMVVFFDCDYMVLLEINGVILLDYVFVGVVKVVDIKIFGVLGLVFDDFEFVVCYFYCFNLDLLSCID